MPHLGVALRVAGERKHRLNHIEPTRGAPLSHRFKAAFAAAVAVLADPRERERGDQDRRSWARRPRRTARPSASSAPTSTTSSRTGRRSTSATRSSSSPAGFHNTDLPKKGGTPAALLLPTGQNVTGLNDAAGNPFWFNGRVPQVSFNPVARQEQPRQDAELQRRQGASTPGCRRSRKPKPMTVKFTKTGHLRVLLRHPPGDEGIGQGRRQEPRRSRRPRPTPSGSTTRSRVT